LKWTRSTFLVVFAVIIVSAVAGGVGMAQKNDFMDIEYKCVFVEGQYLTTDDEKTSDYKVPSAAGLSEKMEKTLNRLSREGYQVVHISPITRGNYETGKYHDGGWGAGWSFTMGYIIVGEKR